MRLVEIEITNFRSIRHCKLEDLGSAVVLYGPNGAGKSNVLAAIGLWWELVRRWAEGEPAVLVPGNAAGEAGDAVATSRFPRVLPLAERHRQLSGLQPEVRAVLELGPRGLPRRRRVRTTGTVRVELRVTFGNKLATVSVLAPGFTPADEPTAGEMPPEVDDLLKLVRAALTEAPESPPWLHVPALRGQTEVARPAPDVPSASERAARLALEGRFAPAAFIAQSSPDLDLAERLGSLQELLTAAPFSRPAFRAVQNDDGSYAIQEIQRHGDRRIGVPLDLAGLGVQQVYAILGAMVLSKARVVAVEEPEAHLHERTMGRDLRAVLLNATRTGVIDQLFVATHSALFDLDPGGWYEVELDAEGCTTVTRRTDRAGLDQRHLYETGPARHALLDVLHGVEGDRVMYRRADGTPLTASELLRALHDHDDVAIEYLDTLVDVAVRTIGVAARRTA